MFARHLTKKLDKVYTISNYSVSRWSALEKIFNTKPGLNFDVVTQNVVSLIYSITHVVIVQFRVFLGYPT